MSGQEGKRGVAERQERRGYRVRWTCAVRIWRMGDKKY